MDFEVSAMHIGAVAKALDLTEQKDAVVALLSPEARAALKEPHSARWHPGLFAIEVWSTLLKVGGKPLLEEFNYQMTKRSFGPVVGPLIKIGMTLSGSTPASVFSRIDSLTTLALRGVVFEWKPDGKNGGAQTISYPCPVPADVIDAAWRGVFRVTSELVGKTVRIDGFVAESDRSGRFQLSW